MWDVCGAQSVWGPSSISFCASCPPLSSTALDSHAALCWAACTGPGRRHPKHTASTDACRLQAMLADGFLSFHLACDTCASSVPGQCMASLRSGPVKNAEDCLAEYWTTPQTLHPSWLDGQR